MRSQARIVPPDAAELPTTMTTAAGLFDTTQWQDVLESGFGTASYIIEGPEVEKAFPVTVFRAGPIRIAYLGFPLAGKEAAVTLQKKINILENTRVFKRPHAIRFCSLDPIDITGNTATAQTLPETTIQDLQSWNPKNIPKLRRIINRAKRSNLSVIDATQKVEADKMYDLYSSTVRRHNGSVRYTREYFHSIVELSAKQSDIRCLIALDGTEIAGFHVVACHNNTAFYLHGGMNQVLKHLYPSDLLFLTAIEWAKSAGMVEYNMLASPAEQTALVKYKEKWGGSTAPLTTYTLILAPVTMWWFEHILLPSHRWFCKARDVVVR